MVTRGRSQSYRDYRLACGMAFPCRSRKQRRFSAYQRRGQGLAELSRSATSLGSAGEVRLNGGSTASNLPKPDAKSFPRRPAEFGKARRRMEQLRLICRSNTVTVQVNGVLQNEITGASVSSGTIGLQAEGKPVEFRKPRAGTAWRSRET